MMLATDLDRTLLPDGKAPYDGSLPRLFEEIKKCGITLVYVSGRNLALLQDALREYNIPVPDYFIGSVGTEIYKKDGEDLRVYTPWLYEIKNKNPSWDRKKLLEQFESVDGLSLQEDAVQNEYKLSYYIDDPKGNPKRQQNILDHIRNQVAALNVKANVLYSFDPLKSVGLVDVLPENATKLAAVEFLREECGLEREDVVYAGDSGNDILVLASCYKGILVKNAPENVKEEVIKQRKAGRCPNTIYIAKGKGELNGNYSSGILEGLQYFGVIS